MTSIQDALRQARSFLKNTASSSSMDAELLLAHCLKKSRHYLYTYPEFELSEQEWTMYQHDLRACSEGYPLAYVTGQRSFWSFNLSVNQACLIPRPETELLVELSLSLLKSSSEVSLLDLGTGSGAIALALASECPHWQITATDISEAALALAQNNADVLKAQGLRFICSDWFNAVPQQSFHAIVSNPPYLAVDDPHLQQGALRFEPKTALSSGPEGLDALHTIIQQAPAFLIEGGFLLLEHGFQQKNAVQQSLRENAYTRIQTWQDHQGHDRVTVGWR
jgi:release factor glutamine methyltransferase